MNTLVPRGWSLVTGSTTESGIGYAIARQLAARGCNIMLAGSGNKVRQVGHDLADKLEKDFGIKSICLFENLAHDGAAQRLIGQAEKVSLDSGLPITGLVHAAGFALKGSFLDAEESENRDMMLVHVNCPAQLMYHFGRKMREQGYGFILNVGSLLAITPAPMNALYGATKAFERNLSEAVWWEEKEQDGVRVCVALFGAMWSEMMHDYETRLFRFLPFLVMNTDTAAKIAVDGMFKGRKVVIPGAWNNVLACLEPLPRPFTARLARYLMEHIKQGDAPNLEAIERFINCFRR
ncbi:MAG: SDR family NAD(P)-dependent oxidoreductase [Candidatus Moranbacteria bacterium]|nr:SDR family NAD(P)-dependent oxidoreductase [Candidatus Moranbacteria bacterium]